MKVIFIKDVKNQGKKDDIKEVKPGFGEFLIKNGSAVLYTEKSKEILDKELLDRKNEYEEMKEEKTILKKKIEKEFLKFKVSTGSNGKIFGSVSSKQISEQLAKLGYKIDKKKIKLENPLNTLGIFNVKIELHKEVIGIIKVELHS